MWAPSGGEVRGSWPLPMPAASNTMTPMRLENSDGPCEHRRHSVSAPARSTHALSRRADRKRHCRRTLGSLEHRRSLRCIHGGIAHNNLWPRSRITSKRTLPSRSIEPRPRPATQRQADGSRCRGSADATAGTATREVAPAGQADRAGARCAEPGRVCEDVSRAGAQVAGRGDGSDPAAHHALSRRGLARIASQSVVVASSRIVAVVGGPTGFGALRSRAEVVQGCRQDCEPSRGAAPARGAGKRW